MFKYFVWLIGISIIATACNSYDVEGKPEITSTPPNWRVDYILRAVDAKGTDPNTGLALTYEEFVISNKGETGELQIFAINLLSPEGRIVGASGVDPDISRLFSMERSNVGGNGKVVGGDGAGYTAIEGFSFDNKSNAGKFAIAPLCPLVDPLKPTSSKCRSGFDGTRYNTFFKMKVNYKELEGAIYKDMLSRDIKDEGNYALEFCTNDSSKEASPLTCPEGSSYKVQIYRYPNLPPKPYVGLRYNNPIGGFKDYRVIKDPVNMDISPSCPRKEGLDAETASKCENAYVVNDTVAGVNGWWTDEKDTGDPKKQYFLFTQATFEQSCCVENWKDQYCIKYRWELVDTPTPLTPETRITLDAVNKGGEGTWYRNCDDDEDPTIASFKGFMITPTPENKNYKVQIQAITIDKQTQLESDITEKLDIPNIIPAARVMVQLTWKEGLPTRAGEDRMEGVAVDVDVHLIKKKGMDACATEVGADGLMCTSMKRPGLSGIETATHDDCHFNDLGLNGEYVFTDCNGEFQTIGWYASLDLDTTWGGGNYTNPETINLGPIDDSDRNGQPDVNPFSDDYLVVVNYNKCQNLVQGGSNADCEEGGSAYNVHARLEVFVDGIKAPRAHKEGRPDDDDIARIDFVIRPQEWIVLDHITWDQALTTGKWAGDAVVKNPDAAYQPCSFDSSNCTNVSIWDTAAYATWVAADPAVDPYVGGGGSCYDYGTRE
ncbi:MAG TPA: hypothetical protein PLV42_09850 [bacterium]|nr:hypothetical protein [bacterium]